jgi:hypothetical protein
MYTPRDASPEAAAPGLRRGSARAVGAFALCLGLGAAGGGLLFACLQLCRAVRGLAHPAWPDAAAALGAVAVGALAASLGRRTAQRALLVASLAALGVAMAAAAALAPAWLDVALDPWCVLAPLCAVLGLWTGVVPAVAHSAVAGGAAAVAGFGAAGAVVLAAAMAADAWQLAAIAAGGGAALAMAAAWWAPQPAAPSSVPQPRATWPAAAVVMAALWWSAPSALWQAPPSGAVAAFVGVAVAAAWAWAAGSLRIAAVLAGGAAAVAMVWPANLPFASSTHVVLASEGAASAVYVRATQELQLHAAGVLVDAAGPDRPHAALLATLVRATGATGDRVLVAGLGTGRLPALLHAADRIGDVVDVRPEAAALLVRLAADGPVAPRETPWRLPAGWTRHGTGLAHVLAALPAGSRQAVVVGEPLHAAAEELLAPDLQCALREVVGSGHVLLPFELDRVDPRRLARLLHAAARAHAWNAVFAVGDAAVVVAAAAPIDWAALPDVDTWPDEARWLAHACHLGGTDDLRRACLGSVRADATLLPAGADAWPDLPSRAAAIAVLAHFLTPPPAPPADGASLFAAWSRRMADVRRASAELVVLPTGSGERAQAIAARFLPVGAGAAALQAALGLPARDGARLKEPALASRCAHALDPTFLLVPPPLFAELPRVRQAAGDLEDFAMLPSGDRLVALCTGDGPLATALRARFPTATARALVAALARAPLADAAVEALRELADERVLAEAARAVVQRGAVRELLAFWRRDLAPPPALRALQQGDEGDRRALAVAVGGRRDAASLALLAELLVDASVAVRRLAAVALEHTAGAAIPYDPDGPAAAQVEAARQVRSLHTRTP